MEKKQDTLYVGALAKGLKVLRAFDEVNTDLSLSDLVKRTGLEKSAAQRLANTLHVEGMLEKDPETRRFRPSHAWLQLAYAYYWSDPLVARAMPRLIELSQHLGETVNLAELSGDHIVYVTRLPCKRTQFAATLPGRRLPAIGTAAGRVILSTFEPDEWRQAARTGPLITMTPRTMVDRAEIEALIEQAVQDGYAVSRDQMILNEIAVAAPIRGIDGRAVGAVQCSISAHTWDIDSIGAKIAPLLQDTANSISPGAFRS